MVETFLFGFNTVAPMMLLMLLGYYLKGKNVFDDFVLKKMNSFAFHYCIPALMFSNVYELKGIQDIPVKLMLFLLISLGFITLFGIVIATVATHDCSQKGVIVQMSFRSNYAVVGAAMAQALGGTAGSAVSASLQAPAILYFNIVAVICLTIWSNKSQKKINIKALIISVGTNPLILAQVLAIICLAIRAYIPVNSQEIPAFSLAQNFPWLYAVVKELTKMASPLVLILLGAQIDFRAVGNLKKILILSNALRLVIAPAIGLSLAWLANTEGVLNLNAAIVSALLPLYASPSPAAAAVMAEAMDCDGELARQGVVWTTSLSMVTLMFWIVLLRCIGYY
jgi:malate permease and related proteins